MKMNKALPIILILTAYGFSSLFAEAFYVSPKGSDSNSGTEKLPFKTIQVGVNALTPGCTLYIKSGTYREKILIKTGGAPGKYVTIRSFKGSVPVIDGKNVPGETSIYMHDKSYIKIIGLKICNNSAASLLSIPKAIFIEGHGSNIQLIGNVITKINTFKNGDTSAFGIAVYGTDADKSINNFVIESNVIFNCTLGRGGALALSGNVENFKIIENTVRGHDNTGISLRGFRGTCPDPELDQARGGVCRGNTVSSIDSRPNPVFYGERSAAGIHVDGAKDIVIERNKLFNCNYGIAVGCRNPGKTASGVTVKNNYIYYCHISGINLGGPSHDSKNAGWTNECVFSNNTLFNNGLLNTPENHCGNVNMQWASSCTFRNNIFYVCDSVKKTKNYGVANTDQESCLNIIFDENVWYCKNGQKNLSFMLNGDEVNGFKKWQDLGYDENSTFTNPEFKDSTNFPPTLRLKKTSKVVNAGVKL